MTSLNQPIDPREPDRFFSQVYDALRETIAQQFEQRGPSKPLKSSALIHEVYLQLTGANQGIWNERMRLFLAAADAMRRTLIELARRALATGGSRPSFHLEPDAQTLLAFDRALDALMAEHPEKAKIVKLRYLAGLENREIAELTGVSEASVERHWSFATAWLSRAMQAGIGSSSRRGR